MIWWITATSRAERERTELADLQERREWLEGLTWRLENGLRLVADFTLVVGETHVPLVLRYPDFFPDVPPSVSPTDDVLLSGHQYGRGGELCLEYRADNWVSTISGAMMVESAYRLLSGEQGEDAPAVPSAHRSSLGQDLRGSAFRFALTSEAKAALHELELGQHIEASVSDINFGDTWVAGLSRLGSKEASVFEAPARTESHRDFEAAALRLPAGEKAPKSFSPENLPALLEAHGLGDWFAKAREAKRSAFVILVSDIGIRLPSFYVSDTLKVIEYRTLTIETPEARLPETFAAIGDKRIGIVGCGSVGSKVAVSLARSGAANFLLLDPDLFLPENAVRNELDLRAVAVHKARALRERILEVNPAARIDARSILLGGQESAESTASAMSQLAKCDVLVDATADADVFNLCAAVAKAERKPMVWGQVFGGGIGGLVAMARPNLDPPPQLARNQIIGWYANRGVAWDLAPRRGYDGQRDGGPPVVASDAEVTLIAGHLTRFVLDRLIDQPASFPSPAYVTGFAKEWIFSGPFDTWPIDYAPEGDWGPQVDENAAEALPALLGQLFPKVGDED